MRDEKCGMGNEWAGTAERGVLRAESLGSFELGPSSPDYTLNSELGKAVDPKLRTQNPELKTSSNLGLEI